MRASRIGTGCRRGVGPLLLLLLLVACGSAPVDEATAARRGTLDYHLTAPPGPLDPARAVDAPTLDLLTLLFDGLTRLDSRSGIARPALALDWDLSDNGRTYTFKLREDALWIDRAGQPLRPVEAADIAFSIKRVCAPDSAAPLRHVLFIIKGCEEVARTEGVPDLDRVAVRAVDQFAVEFTLRQPAAYFPTVMSLPVAYPVHPESASPPGSVAPLDLVTSGPYRLVNATDRRLELLANPYHPQGVASSIERIVAHIEPEAERARASFEAGELDLLYLPEGVPDAALAADYPTTRVVEACTYAYGVTTVKAPVNNPRVRRALSFALDRSQLVDEALSGAPLPAALFAPPAVFGAPPAATHGVSYDAARARALLAEAGYPTGQGFPPIRLLTPDGAQHERLAAGVAAMWRQSLQIEVQVDSLPWERYLEEIRSTNPLESAPHIWLMGWCGDYPDEYTWLNQAFALRRPVDAREGVASRDGAWATTQAGGNSVRRVAGDVDVLLEQAAAERDVERRRILYQQAEYLLVVEEAVVIPLYHRAVWVATQPWLSATFTLAGGQPLDEWQIEMGAKDRALTPGAEETDDGG